MNHLANFDLIIFFFILGAFASWIRSDLEIPEFISKFLSIFLLLSLGLKGGHEVRFAESLTGFIPSLTLGLISCLALPIIFFFAFKNRLGVANASALSASYGSVSAVTFITAQGILENDGINFSGYMVAIMALMEIPAILIGVYLYQRFSKNSPHGRTILASIFSAKSVVLLLGGFVIGLLMNEKSWAGISPVVQGSFKGVLAFFLLDLGIVAQKQLREAWKFKYLSLPIAIIFPLICGTLSLFVGHSIGISQGDLILLATLVGSASYIAAPAAMRSSIPSANPSLYLALPLAMTFPMNLIFGIPLYIEISKRILN
ncbi:MAG: sodium-dependent bicarbonate transport family permease [Bdellovibrionota bacterium]